MSKIFNFYISVLKKKQPHQRSSNLKGNCGFKSVENNTIVKGNHCIFIKFLTNIHNGQRDDKIKLIGLKQKNPQLNVLVYNIVQPDHGMIKNCSIRLTSTEFFGYLQTEQKGWKNIEIISTKEEKIGYTNLVNAMKKAFQFHSYILAVVGMT